jgi:uncharacterized protein YjiS (DUF1127 family)
MAISFDTARPASVTARAIFAAAELFGRVFAWNDARRTRAILSRLSTHELDDIGLSRGDIDAFARNGF